MVVSKPVLVLLPPMGHSEDFYQFFEKELENYFIIKTLNYPIKHKSNDFSMIEEYVAYFCEEIRKIQGRVYLCGLSLGATLSLCIKEKLDDQVISIILIASGGLKVARARKEMVLHHVDHITSSKAFVEKALSLDCLDNFILHFNNTDSKDRAREYFQDYLSKRWHGQYEQSLGKNFIKAAAEAIEINYEKRLSKYQSEIHLIWGMKDRVFSVRHLKRFEKIMPKATIHKFDNGGHYLPLESPKECAKILINLCNL